MIVSLSMVQSEGDIIEYFVRSNLRLLDHMFIVLNPSEDGTAAILSALVRERLPITVWPTSRNYFSQSEILSTLANRIRDQIRPEFLCFLDADELFLSKDRESFSSELSRIPAGQIGLVPWRTFVPPNNQLQYTFRPDEWTSRLEREIAQFHKAVVPRLADPGLEITVPNGQHNIAHKDGSPFPLAVIGGLPLAHLPARSIPQIRAKTFAGIINKSLAEGVEWHAKGESYQLCNTLLYLEHADEPDIRDIACKYLAKDWTTSDVPSVVEDISLPVSNLLYGDLVQNTTDEIRILKRLMNSCFAATDPTAELQRRSSQSEALTSSEPTSIFWAAFHARNLMCDWPPFSYVVDRFRPSSVLDVGCGLGAYLSLFRRSGASILGIDGFEWSTAHHISKDQYKCHDLRQSVPGLHRKFDTSVFVETAEHLPEFAALAIIDQLASLTNDAIVFSAAQLNQPGHGHITCRDPAFWLERFEAHGWYADAQGSLSLRFLATLHWFRRNLFLLTRNRELHSGLPHLLDLGVHRDGHGGNKWPSHRPAETIIGFPGQRWSFNMTGDKEVEPLPPYR